MLKSLQIALLTLLTVFAACKEDKLKTVDQELLDELIKVPIDEELRRQLVEFDPYPPRSEDGRLPRSLEKYTLSVELPFPGKEFRDQNEVILLENVEKSRRLRLFAKDSFIIRMHSLALLSSLTDESEEAVLQRIRDIYGIPDATRPKELIYYDGYTVLVFKIGDIYLITEMTDAQYEEFPSYIFDVIDKNYDKYH